MYVHLNLDKYLVQWEAAIGRVNSLVMYDPTVYSSWFISRLRQYANNDYFDREILLELCRVTNYPNLPSRLDCAFLFPSLEAATIALKSWNSFNEENLQQLEVLQTDNQIDLDGSWIEGFKRRELDFDQNVMWMNKYWSEQHSEVTPPVECLFNGVAKLINQEVRVKCFNKILAKHPNAFAGLIRSMYSFDQGCFFSGLAKYRRHNQGEKIKFELNFLFNDTLRPEISEIKKYIDSFSQYGNGLLLPEGLDWDNYIKPNLTEFDLLLSTEVSEKLKPLLPN